MIPKLPPVPRKYIGPMLKGIQALKKIAGKRMTDLDHLIINILEMQLLLQKHKHKKGRKKK